MLYLASTAAAVASAALSAAVAAAVAAAIAAAKRHGKRRRHPRHASPNAPWYTGPTRCARLRHRAASRSASRPPPRLFACPIVSSRGTPLRGRLRDDPLRPPLPRRYDETDGETQTES
jgi:hypothetical protein